MSRRRFLAYLTGGIGPGASGRHDGAGDPSDPRDDRPVTLRRRLIFTGESKRWGGGVCAVVRNDHHSPGCLGRGWLITVGQLIDVWRQENGGQALPVIPWEELDRKGFVDTSNGRYRRLDRLDPIDGRRAVTITCGPEMLAEIRPPTEAYLAMVAVGLAETWAMSDVESRQYLSERVEVR